MDRNFRKKKVTLPILVLLSLIFIYSSSTYLRTRYSFFIAVAAYIGFFCVSTFWGNKWRFNSTYVWGILAIIACPAYVLNGAGDKITTYLSGIIYLLFWYNVFVYLSDSFSITTIKCFVVANIAVLITNIFTTIGVLEIYPLAARAINGRAEGITERDVAIYMDMGCGGFGFIYGCMFVSLGIAAAFRAKEITTKLRVFSIFVYILIFDMILAAEFTTALLMTVVMLLFCLIINSKTVAVNLMVVSIIFVLVLVFSQQIMTWLKSVAVSMDIGYLANKMDMLIKASNNDTISNLSRTKRYMQSLSGIATNPILGVGTSGGHSQILDTFSTVGLFAFPYLMILFSIFKDMRKYIDDKYVFIYGICILTLATLNPFVDSTIISLSFMLTPTLLYCFVPKTKRKIER